MAINNSLSKTTRSVNSILNDLLDSEGYKKRLDELLKDRAPQFISSLISLCNATPALKKVVFEAPETIIQSGLKAASYDLPIDAALGYAYIIPFNNKKQDDSGKTFYAHEAMFVMGYRGMHQLAMRTGVYKYLNHTDIREGELISRDRLKGTVQFKFYLDDIERLKHKVIGYAAFYETLTGMEKTVYKSVAEIEAHEEENRKGDKKTKTWIDDFDAMALKTVYRELLGKWGLMSVDYQKNTDAQTLKLANDLASGDFDDELKLDYKIEDTNAAEIIPDKQPDWMNEQPK